MRLSTKQLVGIGGYIGYSVREWAPLSERYLAGYRHGVAIFDLAQSSFYLRRAFHFVEGAVMRYSRGFFYGFSRPDFVKVQPLAHFGQIVSIGRWGGGFLTNLRAFRRRVMNAHRVPGFLVCFRFETQNYSALREKARLHLPLVCPIDSNTSVGYVEYPIPGNAGNRANAGYFGAIFSRAVFSGVSARVRLATSVGRQVRAHRRAVRSNNLALAAQLQRQQPRHPNSHGRFRTMSSGLGGSGIGPLR
jgi:ribosomal protein S2